MKKEILKRLKSDYERLEIKPSVDLWDRIEQVHAETEKEAVFSAQKHFQWLKYVAVVLLFLSVGAILYFSSDFKKEGIPHIVNNDPETQIIDSGQDAQTVQKDPLAEVFLQNGKDQLQISPIQKSTNKEEPGTEDTIPIQKEKLSLKHDEIKTQVIEQVMMENPEIKKIAEHKKVNYINADELLQGHEFDKTRQESHSEHKKFGVLDMTKIKLKSPNSLKIFGMTVFSDSLETN